MPVAGEASAEERRHIEACYDAVARPYAERFAGELAHKPMDRELLARFAAEVKDHGVVYDLGCGPGQTTAFLHDCGVRVYPGVEHPSRRAYLFVRSTMKKAELRHSQLGFSGGAGN